jgi:hypothetical protein
MFAVTTNGLPLGTGFMGTWKCLLSVKSRDVIGAYVQPTARITRPRSAERRPVHQYLYFPPNAVDRRGVCHDDVGVDTVRVLRN